MRIRRLIIDNINSLAGKWEIDFTHPELCKQGLFTITGPTSSLRSNPALSQRWFEPWRGRKPWPVCWKH